MVLGIITSCKNDETIVNDKLPEDFQEKQEFVNRTNAMKTNEMIKLDAGLKKISKDGPEKYITPEGKLNENGLALLVPLAKDVLLSSGKTDTFIRSLNEEQIVMEGIRSYQESMQAFRKTLSLTE